ncbi:MAG: hypothetical protein HY906_05995, partial [Deltaproteobacteria bacterium]|nr:hypothetical protein [Deltaproteobacteria bacterium]
MAVKRVARVVVALVGLAVGGPARGDGVAQVMVAKTIPAATVALIDPESGTSSGGGGTDVKYAVGDVLLFRFKYFPVPDKIIRGLGGYLTEFVPPNTQVVGVRIIDQNGLTIVPRYPGLADDGCGPANCNGFNSVPSASGPRNLDDGSIAQIYADTGVFYATDGRLAREPGSAFITLQNGVLMSPEPRNIGAIIGLVGTSSPIYAHDAWDWVQVRAYGISTAASGNSGAGNTPYLYGSPVPGPQTYYRYEATEVSPGVIQFNDVVGPWGRIRYPGSQIGSGAAATGRGSLARVNLDTSLGYDVTPANALPAGARAVRFALGEIRVGEPGYAEVALRVTAAPLDPGMGKDADCAEVFGGDTSAASDNVRARDSVWPTYLASPACVYLNLLFDLDVDKPLGVTGDTLTYTLHGKNLSLNAQTNVVVKLKYDSTDVAFVSATGGATVAANCDGDGKACLVWPTMATLAPSGEYTQTAVFTVGGGGHVANVMFARYTSTQLPAPGFTTQALTIVKGVWVDRTLLQATTTVAPPGGTASFQGTMENRGTAAGAYDTLTIVLPAGWTINGQVTLGGTPLTCASGCATNRPTYTINSSLAPGQSRTLVFAANVPAGTPTGLYDVDLQLWGSQSGFGGAFETYYPHLATVAVGQPRSDPPVIAQPAARAAGTTCGIVTAATAIEGTTTEADGTVIRLYFGGLLRGTGTAAGGLWSVSNYGAFGPLYGGLEVRATAQAPGEQESPLSEACFVTFMAACADGLDNDGDGLVDFPADPGCTSPSDSSEVDPPPVSPCADGLDNDADGLTDMNDPDCVLTGGLSEVPLPACMDGLDNDGDGLTDFPADPGCHSPNDDDETDPIVTATEVRPRLLIAFDTSGSMNFNTCAEVFTGGDGSAACPGSDVACVDCGAAGCGNGLGDDSRLYQVKAGLADAVRAFGEVDWGLMRFHQRPEVFGCPGANAALRSGGWQGAYLPPCNGGFNAGDLLVSFSQDNAPDLLQWMDGSSNYQYGGTVPPGLDLELRGTGTTPLAGILTSALGYLAGVRLADAKAACRPYRVLLVTDGKETCGGNPVTAAAGLLAAGIQVAVIGFALGDPLAVAQLNAIAAAGGTGSAIFVSDSAALSTAIAAIVSESIKVERCNGLDDDCDGLVDEDFPDLGAPCDNGQAGVCQRFGTRVCAADGLSTVCTAPPVAPGVEVCPPNGLDDDCNGVVDDIPGGCGTCTPEVCNGVDDDCDGQTDELDEVFPCPTGAPDPPGCECPVGLSCANVADLPSCWCPPACGTDIGECLPGVLACVGGQLSCAGATGPTPEVCDGKDNNCDGIIDGFARACYPAGEPGCDVGSGQCQGICRLGTELCPRLLTPAASNSFGPCTGAVTPQPELCNGLDDDCNGIVDDVPGGCGSVCVPAPEVCNGKDDDCNGIVDDNPLGEGDPCVDAFDPALAGVGICLAGRKHCQNGVFVCLGQVGPQAEICNCLDEDCDGAVDNGDTCPPGYACLDCACQPGCSAGEFPCPPDRRCVDPATHDPCATAEHAGCFCLPDPCVTAACDRATQRCEVVADVAVCVDRCPPDQCAPPTVCIPGDGHCADCYELGCAEGEVCAGWPGSCLPNP